MELLQRKASYCKPYYVDNMRVKDIIFYNSTGVICTNRYGYFMSASGESIKSVLVYDINRIRTIYDTSKRTLKAEQIMSEHINFCMSLGTDKYGDKSCELYLYVDNNIIKQTSQVTTQSKTLLPYTLEEELATKTTTTFNISGVTVVVTETDTNISDTQYSQLVTETQQELNKKFINIPYSYLCELLNGYKLVKREIPLTESYKQQVETEIIT